MIQHHHDSNISRFIIGDYSLDTHLNQLRRLTIYPPDVHVAEEMVMDPDPGQQRAMPVPRSQPRAFMPMPATEQGWRQQRCGVQGGVVRWRQEEAAGAKRRLSVASDGARMPSDSNAGASSGTSKTSLDTIIEESDDRPRGPCAVCRKRTINQCIGGSPLATDEVPHAPIWLSFGCECPICHTVTVRAPGSPTHFPYTRPTSTNRRKRPLPHPRGWRER